MSKDFTSIEDRYFLLKGQLETRRITREQFEQSLKDLMVQDEQGRYWMIGADSGKWYVHDGANWVPAHAPGASMPAAPESFTPMPAPPKSSNSILLLTIGAAAIVLLLGAVALLFAASQGILKTSSAAPTILPTVVIVPTIAAPVTVMVIQPTPSTTDVGVTPTSVPPSPTSPLRTATNPPTASPTDLPTVARSTSTPVPPTATVAKPTAIPATPTLAVAPGVYVTAIRTEPAEVKDKQYPSFIVTFLNSIGTNANVNIFIKIFEPDKKASFGETSKTRIVIPPGTSNSRSAADWRGISGSPCRQFIARVFYTQPDNTILEFPKPEGDTFQYYFQVCQ